MSRGIQMAVRRRPAEPLRGDSATINQDSFLLRATKVAARTSYVWDAIENRCLEPECCQSLGVLKNAANYARAVDNLSAAARLTHYEYDHTFVSDSVGEPGERSVYQSSKCVLAVRTRRVGVLGKLAIQEPKPQSIVAHIVQFIHVRRACNDGVHAPRDMKSTTISTNNAAGHSTCRWAAIGAMDLCLHAAEYVARAIEFRV